MTPVQLALPGVPPLPRPTRRTVAAATASELARRLHDLDAERFGDREATAADVGAALAARPDDDGLELARWLETHKYWSIDAATVAELDEAVMIGWDIEHRAVREWVAAHGICTTFAPGDVVVGWIGGEQRECVVMSVRRDEAVCAVRPVEPRTSDNMANETAAFLVPVEACAARATAAAPA